MDLYMFDCTAHGSEYVQHWYRKVIDDADFRQCMNGGQVPHGNIGKWRYRAGIFTKENTALANAVLNGVAMVLARTARWLGKNLRELTR